MTDGLLKSCRKKSRLLKIYKKTGASVARTRYVKYKNILKQALRHEEKCFYENQFSLKANDVRKTWKLINSLLNRTDKDEMTNMFKIDDGTTNDRNMIVNAFNKFFVELGPSLEEKIPPSKNNNITNNLPSIKDSLLLYPTDAHEIQNIISSLKNSASCGIDQIPVSAIKSVSDTISPALASLINHSTINGIFPDALKIAKVTPIFKSGDKSLLSNYRPISLLNAFSKIYEKFLLKRLNSFLTKNNILYDGQFGFRKNRSTQFALVSFLDKITETLDKNEYALSLFIDLSKAFDTINHSLLLKKLSSYGIRGTALELFKNYLSNRLQCVEIDGVRSNLLKITCGVPQGSILGPLLFLLYINDIHTCTKLLKFYLFADDTTVVLTSYDNFINKHCE